MMNLRKSKDRGHFDFGWLSTYHSFSFGEYYDTNHMGFSKLRVINEDFINKGEGFPMHGHKDMEIITYVVSGALAHKDTLNNSTVIKPGEVQRMSAGSGIRHSEYNHLKNQKTHILQIWILPEKNNLAPGYEQKDFSADLLKNTFKLVASQTGEENSVTVHQDIKLYIGKFNQNYLKTIELKQNRNAWIQLIEGNLKVGEVHLESGDGLAISQENILKLFAQADSHFLFFDLPQQPLRVI
ncbi:MAG: pirin family protein [Oligoflexia bacterium]|nr:pirin family protein [Oligoflexia bacterium]